MKKLTTLGSVIADIAHRKSRAARARFQGKTSGLEEPGDVYRQGCATIAASLLAEGFRFAPSGPHATRRRGDLSHRIAFQSSHHNVAGEHVSLSISTSVSSKRLRAWTRQQGQGAGHGYLAGGQIGNLEAQRGLRQWDLADPGSRAIELDDAIATIRTVAFPFFALFADPAGVLQRLDEQDIPSLEPLRALEFSLAWEARDLAQRLLNRFFGTRPDLLAEYHARLEEYRRDGPPPYQQMGYAKDLAKATIRYGLAAPGHDD